MTGWLTGTLLTLVGAFAGAALTRAWSARRRGDTAAPSRDERSEHADALVSLQELSYRLTQTLDLDLLAKYVVDHVIQTMAVDGALLAIQDGTAGAPRVLYGVGTLAHLQGTRVAGSDDGLLSQSAAAEHMIVAHAGEEEGQPHLLHGCPVAVAAALPLRAHGATSGVLAVVREDLIPFSSDELRQLSTVAGHAATIVEKARFVEIVRSGKQHWEATFDAIPDGIAVLDAEGRVRRANQALARMAKRPVRDIVGSEFEPLLIDEAGRLDRFFAEVRSGARRTSVVIRERPGGRSLKITASSLPGPDTDWVVVLIEDVTEREAMEAQLLHNEKMAAVGQLVSGVAHELNNPLSSIAGMADFLLSREAGSQQDREHLRLIHEQADRAGKIVRNLLYFARKGPSEPANVDLNEVARRTTALIGHEMRVQDVDLQMDLAEPLPPVWGDRHELQQVLLNLITNAIQAVRQNGPDRPRVVALSSRVENGQVRLRVTDSGPGIPDEVRPHVFLPFFTTKEPGQGTGLGLSICFRIVEAHGGEIVVGSAPGGGAWFEVRLPSAEPEPGAVDRPASRRYAPGRRILVVEEDPALLTTLGVVLRDCGHVVDAVGNAQAALDLLDRVNYDVIIAEPMAHGRDGHPLAEALCVERSDLGARTLLLTADVRPETTEWLASLNCRVLRKPFDSGELERAVSSILESEADAR